LSRIFLSRKDLSGPKIYGIDDIKNQIEYACNKAVAKYNG
jgi:hypothetical protein